MVLALILTIAGTATPFTLRLRLHSKGAHAASVKCHQGLGMVLTNLEQEELWLQGWDALDDFIERYPGGYLLLPDYKEVSLGEAQEWIQIAAYESNKTVFATEYYKGKSSILINKVPA